MKKTKLQRITSLALTVLMVLGVVIASAGQTYAATGKWELTIYGDMYAGDPTPMSVQVFKWNKDGSGIPATVTKVKSSNKNVIKVKSFKSGGQRHYLVYYKKVGKAKLTVNYTTPDGKKKTLKKTIKVVECPKVIKSLKVNDKNIEIKKDTRFTYEDYNYKKKTAKIKLGLENGWKIESVSANAYNPKTDKYKDIKINKKTITKGKEIKFPKGHTSMDVHIIMRKGEDYFYYSIHLFKN